jgi:hypothetical protein
VHDVADRVVAGEVGTAVVEDALEHADQSRHLVAEDLHHLHVALLRRPSELRAEAPQVRSDAAGLEEGVLDRLDAPRRVGGQDLADAVALAEVEQDRARLPDHETVVLEHGDLVVRVERQELRVELLVLGQGHLRSLGPGSSACKLPRVGRAALVRSPSPR